MSAGRRFGHFGLRGPLKKPARPPVTLPEGARVTASLFRSSDAADTHVASQWRIAEVTDPAYTTLLADTGDRGDLQTSYTLPRLVPGRVYRLSTRQKSSRGRYSSWSTDLLFVAGVEAVRDPSTLPGIHVYPGDDLAAKLASAVSGQTVWLHRSLTDTGPAYTYEIGATVLAVPSGVTLRAAEPVVRSGLGVVTPAVTVHGTGPQIFNQTGKTGWTIRDIGFGGAVYDSVVGQTTGRGVMGGDGTVTFCRVFDCQNQALGGNFKGTATYNEFVGNCSARVNGISAVIKTTEVVTILFNYAHDNENYVFWVDCNNPGATINDNVIDDNWASGIFDEISKGFFTCQRNLLRRNNKGAVAGRGGLILTSSKNADISYNTFDSNLTQNLKIWEDTRADNGENLADQCSSGYRVLNVTLVNNVYIGLARVITVQTPSEVTESTVETVPPERPAISLPSSVPDPVPVLAVAPGADSRTFVFTNQSTESVSGVLDFGDGTSIPLNPGVSASHRYLPGEYIATLTATNSADVALSTSRGVAPVATNPTASFTSQVTYDPAGSTLQLDGSATPGTAPVTDWLWTITIDGGAPTTYTTPSVTLPGLGAGANGEATVVATLQVTASEDGGTATVGPRTIPVQTVAAGLGAPNYPLLAAQSTTEVQLTWLPSQRHLRGDGWEAERSANGGTSWQPVTLEGIVPANEVNANASASWRVGYDRTLPAPGASPLRLLYRFYETSGGVRGPASETAEVFVPVDDYTPVLPQKTVDTTMPNLTGARIITVAPAGQMMGSGVAPEFTSIQEAFNEAALNPSGAPAVEIRIKNGSKWAAGYVVELPAATGNHWTVVRPEDDSFLPAPGTRFVPATHDPLATIDTGNCPILEAVNNSASSCIRLKQNINVAPKKWRFIGIRFRSKDNRSPTSLVDLQPTYIWQSTTVKNIPTDPITNATIDSATQTVHSPDFGFVSRGFAVGHVFKSGGMEAKYQGPWRVVSVTETDLVVDGDLIDKTTPFALNGTLLNPAVYPEDILFDRCWGNGKDVDLGSIGRCFTLTGTRCGVFDTWIDDIQHASNDNQCVFADTGPGPFLVDNCYLAATGENFMFGGSNPKVMGRLPRDITIRRVHLIKKAAWDFTSPSWDGKSRVVKNLWEIKHVGRFLLQDYLFERQINGSGSQADASPIKEGQSDSGIDVDSHDITAEWGHGTHIYGLAAITGMYFPTNGNQSVTDTRRVRMRQILSEQENGGYQSPTAQAIQNGGVSVTADGTSVAYGGAVQNPPIAVSAGSVQVWFESDKKLTDDGAGVLSGVDGSGTIDYTTGVVSVVMNVAPPAGSVFRAAYARKKTQRPRGFYIALPARHVHLDHVTLVSPGAAFSHHLMPGGRLASNLHLKMQNCVFDTADPNAIRRDQLSSGGGEADLKSACVEHITGGNLWIGQPEASYPPTTMGDACPVDRTAAGMTNYGTGDYRIAAGSTYATFATDGGAPGCDIDTLMTRTAGVRQT